MTEREDIHMTAPVYDVTVVVTDTDGALHADVSGADAIVFKKQL